MEGCVERALTLKWQHVHNHQCLGALAHSKTEHGIVRHSNLMQAFSPNECQSTHLPAKLPTTKLPLAKPPLAKSPLIKSPPDESVTLIISSILPFQKQSMVCQAFQSYVGLSPIECQSTHPPAKSSLVASRKIHPAMSLSDKVISPCVSAKLLVCGLSSQLFLETFRNVQKLMKIKHINYVPKKNRPYFNFYSQFQTSK